MLQSSLFNRSPTYAMFPKHDGRQLPLLAAFVGDSKDDNTGWFEKKGGSEKMSSCYLTSVCHYYLWIRVGLIPCDPHTSTSITEYTTIIAIYMVDGRCSCVTRSRDGLRFWRSSGCSIDRCRARRLVLIDYRGTSIACHLLLPRQFGLRIVKRIPTRSNNASSRVCRASDITRNRTDVY